jgi:hypothetical protein
MEGALIQSYNSKLMANDDIRMLMASLTQDPESEQLDEMKSKIAIENIVTKNMALLGTPRRAIIGWLNECNFADLTNKFWFEMHMRMHKILTVSIVLEGMNLKKMGVKNPQSSDIPTAITYLYTMMCNYRKYHHALELAHYAMITSSPPMNEFAQLYK